MEESPAEPPLSPSPVPGVGGVRPSAGDGDSRGEGDGGENRDNRDNRDNEDNGGGTGSAAAGATISRRTRTTTAALGCAVLATLGVLLAWDPPPWTTSPHDSLGGRDGGRLRIGVVVDAPGLSELNRGTISGFEAAMTGGSPGASDSPMISNSYR